MHHDRITQLENPERSEAMSSSLSNHHRILSDKHHRKNTLTPAARLDIAIKEWAFSTDFNLPLEPSSTVDARITTINGDIVASGYDRVVADGESIWLEIPKAHLHLSKFQPRQRTASRNFYTYSGVTAHEQTQTEIGLSPRKHKFAVKVKRNLPSCRLIVGKWYIHAHQVKIETRSTTKTGHRRLRTNRLVGLLRSIFGRAYSPRTYRESKAIQTKNPPRVEQIIPQNNITWPTAPTSYMPTSSLNNFFPLPMQAPPPFYNPPYYAGQPMYNGVQLGINSAKPLKTTVRHPDLDHSTTM